MSFSAKSGAWLSSRVPRCWWWRRRWQQPPCAAAGPSWSYFGGGRPRAILDMSYSRHFLDFQGSSIPSSMKKLVVTKLSQNFREAVTLQQDSPVPIPGDGDLLVRNRTGAEDSENLKKCLCLLEDQTAHHTNIPSGLSVGGGGSLYLPSQKGGQKDQASARPKPFSLCNTDAAHFISCVQIQE